MLGRDDDDGGDGDGGERRDRRIGERRRARLARVRPPLASSPRGTARVASEAGAGASRAGSVAVRRGGSRVQGRGRTRGGIRRDQEAQDIQRQRRYATARRRDATPPDASPANQLPRASPRPNGSRQDRPSRPRLDGVPGHDRVPIRHAGSRRCATATPIVSEPDALAPTATHPGATFAFERSDSNCQMIVAAATRPFSPDPSTSSRPSIHSPASPR